jgi:hypothetical protein
MSLQYATGTNVHATVAADNKTTLIGNIQTQLTTAGWTVVSGGGTTDVRMACAATPQGNQIRVRIFDGGGNCVRIRVMNVAETIVMTDSGYLLPATSKTFIINATRHQFAIWCGGSDSTRDFVMVSAMYIPTHLTGITTLAFLMSQSVNDTDTTDRGSFRVSTSLRHPSNGFNGNFFGLVNSTVMEHVGDGTTTARQGVPGLLLPRPADNTTTPQQAMWHDSSSFILEPLMGWGLSDINDPWRIYGQIWNAAINTEAFTMDQVPTAFNGKNWINLTSNNTGNNYSARGSLFLTTP